MPVADAQYPTVPSQDLQRNRRYLHPFLIAQNPLFHNLNHEIF